MHSSRYLIIVVGSLGEPRPEVDPLSVEEARGGTVRWGSEELHVSGWYAELDADCVGDTAAPIRTSRGCSAIARCAC